MAAAYALIFYRNAYDKVHTESTKKRLNQLIKLRFSLFKFLIMQPRSYLSAGSSLYLLSSSCFMVHSFLDRST